MRIFPLLAAGLVVILALCVSKQCTHQTEGIPIGSTKDGATIVKTSSGEIVEGIGIGSAKDGVGVIVLTDKCR